MVSPLSVEAWLASMRRRRRRPHGDDWKREYEGPGWGLPVPPFNHPRTLRNRRRPGDSPCQPSFNKLDTTPTGKFKMAGASLDIQLEISNMQAVKADPLWAPGFDGVP